MSTPRDKIEAKLGLTGPPLQTVRDSPPTIPDHVLVRRIGQGAYGEVWLARNALGTWRAVKIVYRDNFKDARPYEREFAGIRRFEPLSRSNEGFVDVLQVGRDDPGGWFYYVMELADAVTPVFQPASSTDCRPGDPTSTDSQTDSPTGKSALQPDSYTPRTLARDLHQRGRLPLEDCLQLGLTLALALGHLHRHGLIHRDVKPSNIIFVGGVPKLADIGLVTEAQGANTFVGTEGFVPPEGPTSPQADLYALGKVLYEAAMGKDRNEFPEPFTQISTDRESIALMELNTILLRACAPDPKQRYASAEQMHADLALLHSGGSVRRQRKLAGQLRFVQRAGALVTALAAVIALGWWWQVKQTRAVRELAAEKSRLTEEKSNLAEEQREQLVRLRVANGVRLLDQDDHSGALLWLANALSLVTNRPAEEVVHRIRIQQVLEQMPRQLMVMPHDGAVFSGALSPDGALVATASRRPTDLGGEWEVRLWNVHDGSARGEAMKLAIGARRLRFSHDGLRLLVRSFSDEAYPAPSAQGRGGAVVLDVATGQPVYPAISNAVTAVFSPDDQWLAVARTNHVVEVFEAGNGRRAATLKGHSSQINMVAFSSDGSLLASASLDRTVRTWRMPSGESAGPPLHHNRGVERLVVSSNGLLVASSEELAGDSEVSAIRTWSVHEGREIGPTIVVSNALWTLALGPQRRERLIVGDLLKCLFLNPETHAEAVSVKRPAESPRSWAFSPDGFSFAGGDDSGRAFIWSLETGEPQTPSLPNSGYVESVSYDRDGARLLTTSEDGTAKLWSLDCRTESARLSLPVNFITNRASFWDRMAFGRTPGLISIPLADQRLHLVNPASLREEGVLGPDSPGHRLFGWTANHNRQLWAIVEGTGQPDHPCTVVLWNRAAGESKHSALPRPSHVSALAFVSEGSRLLTFSQDQNIRVWKTSDGSLEQTLATPANYVPWDPLATQGDSSIFHPRTGSILLMAKDQASAGGAGPPHSHLQLFDPFKGEWIGRAFNPFQWGAVNKIGFSPDGSRLAFVTQGQIGRVVDWETKDTTDLQFKHGAALLDLDWSPDGKRLLTAGLSFDVKLWDAASGRMQLAPMRTSERSARLARWSADGRFVATRSDDGIARVWDAATAEPVTPLLRHAGDVRWVCITAEGRLITASDPNLLSAWDLKPTTLPVDVIADYAKLLSGRRLSPSGAFLPLRAQELAELARSLRRKAPELFE